MNFPFRAGRGPVCFLAFAFASIFTLHGQEMSPFGMDKQFSADQVITTKDGTTVNSKVFMDGGKVRMEISTQGMNMISLVLPAEQKAYSIMPDQKMVMVMPYDPSKNKNPAADAINTKFDPVGPDIAEGVPCIKYKGVSPDNKVFFLWSSVAGKTPVKMAAEDGSFSLLWKNYHAGPQDPALFTVPSGYQTMTLPSVPGLPGGAAPASSPRMPKATSAARRHPRAGPGNPGTGSRLLPRSGPARLRPGVRPALPRAARPGGGPSRTAHARLAQPAGRRRATAPLHFGAPRRADAEPR